MKFHRIGEEFHGNFVGIHRNFMRFLEISENFNEFHGNSCDSIGKSTGFNQDSKSICLEFFSAPAKVLQPFPFAELK